MINGHKLIGLIGEREQRNMRGGRRKNRKWLQRVRCCVTTELLFEWPSRHDHVFDLCKKSELKLFDKEIVKGS